MYLYEPRINETREMYVAEIAKLAGIGESEIVKKSFRVEYIESIKCFVSAQPFTLQLRKELYAKVKYENEYWIKMKDVINDYYISNYGRVKRVFKNGKEILRLPQKSNRGVMRIELFYKNAGRNWTVSQLVVDHFLEPKEEENHVVWHKNGDKLDDSVENLEWIDKKTLSKIAGSKAREKKVVLVCKETGKILKTFRSAKIAAKELNYCYTTFISQCRGLHKNKKGEIFFFEKDYKAMEDEFMLQGMEITGERVLNYLKIFKKVKL